MSLRLTLRTLLAYLDDTLEPAKAREIGQKVSESEQAQELIERIRTVMRRRRLIANAADPDATDLDANDVAEYIDNVLDPEKLGVFEQACIDSDMNLAEVASVHQILTLVLGKPAEVSDECRERMYGLIGSKGGKPTNRTPVGPRASRRRAKKAAALADSQAIPLPLPPYAEGLPPSRKLGSIATVIALSVALCFVIWWMIQPTLQRAQPTIQEAPSALAQAPSVQPNPAPIREVPPTEAPIPAPPLSEDAVSKESETTITTTPAQAPPETVPDETSIVTDATLPETPAAKSEPSSPLPPEAQPMDTPEVATTTTPSESEVPPGQPTEPTRGPDRPDSIEPPPAPMADDETETAVASGTPDAASEKKDLPLTPDLGGLVPLASYVSPEGLLLKYVDGKLQRMKKDDDFLYEGEEIINPEGYRSLFSLPSKDQLELVGQTRIFTKPMDGQAPQLAIPEGKFVYRLDGRSGRIGIQVGERNYTLKLNGEKALVGGEILTSNPPARNQTDKKMTRELALYVIRGNAEVGRPGGLASQVAAGNELILGPGDGDALIQPTDLPPAWIVTSEATERKSALKLAERIPYKTRVEMSLREEAINAERSVRRLAILAMGATGDVDGLVSTLVQPNLPDAREAAIEALRKMIWQDTSLLPALQGALVRGLGPANAPLATDLILGFSTQDQAEAKTYSDLINLLDADQLVLRELAIYNLMNLTGGRTNYSYSADAPTARRRTAINSWKRWFDSERTFPPRKNR